MQSPLHAQSDFNTDEPTVSPSALQPGLPQEAGHDEQPFLKHFPANERSTISNIFLKAIRDYRAQTPALVLYHVERDFKSREQDGQIWGRDHARWLRTMGTFRDHRDDATAQAEYHLWWESLTYEQKQEIRQPKGDKYRRDAMAAKLPSVAQIVKLRGFGHYDIPGNMLEAHDLIDQYVRAHAAKGGK